MAVRRVNHGTCRCGAPILYQGAEFCSLECNARAYGPCVRHCVLCRTPIELTQESQVCDGCRVAGERVCEFCGCRTNARARACCEQGRDADLGVVSSFRGQYWFLSNFFPAQVLYEGRVYPSSEHAYQAAKSLDPAYRESIRNLERPGEAKDAGQRVLLRPYWEAMKASVMLEVVRDKFRRNAEPRRLLLATGDARLVEGNNWGDTFWGVCRGKGENRLGEILMRVRAELRAPVLVSSLLPRLRKLGLWVG